MNFKNVLGVGAIMKLQVRKVDTDELVRESGEFHNVVLNTGLAQMGNGRWASKLQVGTGNSAPNAAQTSLDSPVATTEAEAAGTSYTGGIQVVTAPYYWWGRKTWRFSVGAATGNISEVALGFGGNVGQAPTGLWNRALVRDAQGNPTAITVLEDEYLDVITEIRVYPSESTGTFNLVDKTGAVISTHTYKGYPYFGTHNSNAGGWVEQPIRCSSWSSNSRNLFLVSTSALPSGVHGKPTGTPFQSGVSHEVLPNGVRIKRVITSSEGNFAENAGHKSFLCGLSGLMCGGTSNVIGDASGFKWEVDPPIPKNNETILTYSWSIQVKDIGDQIAA